MSNRLRRSTGRSISAATFIDTAWAYGDGHSEKMVGASLKRHPGRRLYVATKIPPKNRKWPARPWYALEEVFPADYIRELHREEPDEHRRLDTRSSAAARLDG